ncbi:unnamed protein product [Rotaria sp. Silwood1]|nr:unnamed protein product [Rotaria sp. Silwood1]
MEGVTGIMEHGLTGLKDEQWENARSIVSPVFSTTKLKAMYGLMNEISDMYNKRLLEYADKQEIFDVKMLNGQYTLDNIASCLFARHLSAKGYSILLRDTMNYLTQLINQILA